jgi:hypothetical protein
MLRRQKLWSIVNNVIVENIRCSLHALIKGLISKRGIGSLLWIEVSTLYQKFLQLQEIVLNVVVFLKELVLVCSLLHYEVLLPNVINRCLIVFLELLYLDSSVNDVLHSFLQLGSILVLGGLSGSFSFPVH